MAFRTWAPLVAALVAGCSTSSPHAKGRIVVALTIDWEGAYLSPDGLDALDDLRKTLGDVPITHFVSAAYFTKQSPDPNTATEIAQAVRKGDELAVHLHAWRSLARASGVAPKISPSFLNGTDKLFQFDDGDVGFDTDLDVYDAPALRAILRTSRRLLEQTHLPVAHTFRAGGYLGTPRVVEAIGDEGYTVDSSAADAAQLVQQIPYLAARVHEIYPHVTATSQPYFADPPDDRVIEMPIAAIADYVDVAAFTRAFEAAHAQLQQAPGRDVFVVLAFHQETAQEFAPRIAKAIAQLRANRQLAADVIFTTLDDAAELARAQLAASPASSR